jgi:hypothetical protein
MATCLMILQTNHSFAQSGDVVISSDTTWVSGTYHLNSLTVTNNARLTLQGANTTGQVGGQWVGQGVTIDAVSIQVDSGSSISADEQGYTGGATGQPGNGPGGGCGTMGFVSAGGSYGGLGYGPSGCDPGPIYGSALTPTDPGSGGGGTTTTSGGGGYGAHVGGDGGGAIRLIVSGTLTNNGTISANGGNGLALWPPAPDSYALGGSGGSIWITAAALTGSGVFTANGGNRYWGGNPIAGGGGGRIAVYYGVDNSFGGFDSSTANGGIAAQQGTVAFFDTGSNDLLVTGGQRFIYGQDSSITFHNITVRNGASLTVGGNSTVTVTGTIWVTGNSDMILGGKNTDAQVGGQWVGQGVTLTAVNVQVDSGSSINADEQGYTGGATGQPGNGPGGGCGTMGYVSAGGSYGGLGYGTYVCTPGPTYGSALTPTDLGSGAGGTTTTSGGGGYGNRVGGNGGGAIRLIVTGTLNNNGTISANGGNGLALWPPSPNSYAGGGSGGSIWITVATMTGSGLFAVNGGSRYWNNSPNDSGGGGGRIAIYYASSTFSGTVTASNGGVGAQDGTVNQLSTIAQVTIGTNPVGRSFTVDGTPYNSTQTFSWSAGSTHTIATSTPQAGPTGTRYMFANWSDSGAVNHSITIPYGSTTYTASFTTQYLLTTAVLPVASGSIIASPSSVDGYYNNGAAVQLNASANSGYYFANWSGNLSGSGNPQNLIMNAPKSATANFTNVTMTSITVGTNPVGRSFTVDTVNYATPQTFSWVAGSSHIISTTSPQQTTGTRYMFTDWSDGGAISHTITVPASATTYTASFTTEYLLTALASPPAGGSVNATPASADGYYISGTAVQLTATENSGYYFSFWSGDLAGTANPQVVTMSAPRSVTAAFMPEGSSVDLDISPGGAAVFNTPGSNGTTQIGYASLAVHSSADPYGTAVFSFVQQGVTVTEAGVPASPPTNPARVFIDWRSSVLAVPGQSNSGTININTGIAVVNTGTAAANVTYTLRDISGTILAVGNGTIAAGAHFAKFIDQLIDVAPNFSLPANFQIAVQFASLEIAGDQPLSVLALRGTNNQRNDFLITTTPVADLTKPLSSSSIYFPQFVDGGGYTTSLVLLNTSSVVEAGALEILDDNGAPLSVQLVGGTAGSSFRYSIQPNGAFRLQTDGSPTNFNKGWVRLTPDAGTSTPIGSGIFAYNPADMLLSESGIPSAISTTHARIFADLSGSHNTGLAIANITSSNASIAISAFQMDGATPIGTSQGPLPLSAHGHDAKFADQFISGLPAGFTGVLDISSTTLFAALTIRSLLNERHDFLMTTFPIANANAPAPSPIVFPQVVDGGGYVTQFIFISPAAASSMTLNFWDEYGAPLDMGN